MEKSCLTCKELKGGKCQAKDCPNMKFGNKAKCKAA